MKFVLVRRSFLMGAGVGVLAACTHIKMSPGSDSIAQFVQIESQLGGRVGVAALDTGNGRQLSHRGDERFAMCSSYKWVLAATVLARADKGEIALNRRIAYSVADLIDVSPVTKAHVDEGSLLVEDLCAASVEVSDNAAANLLLRTIGGPENLTQYLRQIGDPVTRLDRNEPGLNSNIPGDVRDTTTPSAMVQTMDSILVENVLSSNAREKLIGWMKNCRTGLDRLRAGLPPNWVEGDKTGTGMNGAAIDNAIVWPPQRKPILIAAYLSGSNASPEAINAAHARIGGIVATALA